MIEAVNKTLKYRYLFRKPIADLGRLQEVMKESVADYNSRPKQCLNGLSSDDAHVGIVFDKHAYRERLRVARENRLRVNRGEPHPCAAWDTPEAETAAARSFGGIE